VGARPSAFAARLRFRFATTRSRRSRRRRRNSAALASAKPPAQPGSARPRSGRFSVNEPTKLEDSAKAGKRATSKRRKRRAPLPTPWGCSPPGFGKDHGVPAQMAHPPKPKESPQTSPQTVLLPPGFAQPNAHRATPGAHRQSSVADRGNRLAGANVASTVCSIRLSWENLRSKRVRKDPEKIPCRITSEVSLHCRRYDTISRRDAQRAQGP